MTTDATAQDQTPDQTQQGAADNQQGQQGNQQQTQATPVQGQPANLEAPVVPEAKPSGDNRVDAALAFLRTAGIGSDDPEVEAARSGDFTLLEAKLKVLGDKAKGWETYLGLAKDAYNETTAKAKAQAGQTAKAVHAAVGGEAQWNAIRTWASAQASPEEREEVNAAFAAGGLRATAMAKYLSETYTKVHGKAPAAATKGNAATSSSGFEPLTSREFGRKAAEFIAKANGRPPEIFPEYRALVQRRLASRKAGVN